MKTFACLLSDIPQNGTYSVILNQERYLLYKEGDTVFAVTANCPHLGGPLEKGEVEDGCVTCPWHLWRFDLKSGHCENVPNQHLRAYKVLIEKEKVFLELRHEL
jgi:nitrite reductase (NADH) small subunit